MFRKNIFRLLASLFLALSPILYIILPAVIGSVIALGILVPEMSVYSDSPDDLYWVGGSATWDGTAGTKWSDTDGGAGGHAVPTGADIVHFTAASGVVTVTIGAAVGGSCRSIDFTGFTGNIAGTGSIYLYSNPTSSITLGAGMHFTGTPNFNMMATVGGNTITSNGITIPILTINGVGGETTLVDALSATTLTLTNGALLTNTQNVTVGTFNLSGSTARTFNMTNSTVTVNRWNATTTTNLTLPLTGSTLNMFTDSAGYFYGGGLSYNNVVMTAYGEANPIGEANTFANLTITTPAAAKGAILLKASQTITGILTLTGTDNATKRLCIYSDITETHRHLTAAVAAPNITNTAFTDVTGDGAASWDISGGDNLDCGGNAGITFTSAYLDNTHWVNGSGNGYAAGSYSHYSCISGGAGGRAAVGPGDFIMDANSGPVETVITWQNGAGLLDCYNFDATNYVGTFEAESGSGWIEVVNDFTMGASVPDSAEFASVNMFNPAATSNVTTHGVTLHGFKLETATHTVTLVDSLKVGTVGLSISAGEFDSSNQAITITGGNFVVSGAGLKDIDLGTSTITINSGDWSVTSSTGLTYDFLTSHIILVSPYDPADNVSFGGFGLSYNDVTMNINSGASSAFTGANTFSSLSIIGVNGTSGVKPVVEFAADQVITGNFTATGYNSTSRRLQLRSNSLGTSRQITLSNPAIVTNTDFRDIAGNPASMWDLSATNSGDLGGNYGITFITAINCYWVMNSGSWSDINHWALTSGGTGGTARIPVLGVDVAVFDANSTTFGGRTITMDLADVASIDASQAANNPTFSATTVTVYGSVSLGTVTWSVTNTYFAAEEPTYLLSNSSMGNIYVAKTGGGTLAFGTDIVSTGTVYLSSGILDLNDYDLTALAFDSSTTTYVRQILMGQGTVTLNSTAATTKWNVAATNLTVTRESSLIRLTNSGANAQTFAGSGLTYGSMIIEGAGNYALSITGANTFRDVLIDRSVAAKTVRWPTSVTTVVTNLYIPISGATVVTMYGTTAPPTANVWTISKSAGVVITDYISLEDSTATGGAVFYAGSHSTNVGHNTGWLFSDPANPFVETSAATEVTHNSVSLNGQLLSITPVTVGYAYFQVGLTTSYGLSTPEQAMTGIGTYTRALVGLEPGTTYHYRAAFRYSGSSYTYGSDAEFTTSGSPPGVPVVITGTAVNLTTTSATLQGTLSDMGLYTTVYTFFEYGTSTFYGTQTAEITQAGATGYSTGVTGLTDGVTYYFRAVARYDISSYVYGDGITFRYVAPGGLIPVRKAEEAPPTVLPVPQGLNLFNNPMTFPITAWPGYQSMSKAADALGWTVPITYSIFFIGIAMLIGLAATLSINTIWGFIVGFGVTMGAFTSSGIGDFWVNFICIIFSIFLGFLWRNN